MNLKPRARFNPAGLRAIPLFSGLAEAEVEKIATLFSEKTYQPGQSIVNCGEPAKEFFLIQNGLVRVYRLNESGEQVVLALLGGGDCFGEMGLFTDSFRTAWVEAITDVKVYQMHKVDFRNLLLATPELCWQMLGILSQRLAKMDEQMENLICLNVKERLLKALSMLAQELGRKEGESWVLPPYLTHRLLGELIGTSRETVTRALGRLEKQGRLKRDGNSLQILTINLSQ
ncbi:MAG TPA: Crp/Fnr family transcriptional regulator [Peptococcaceae bacterium]|nr:Crp/Fnr family transcriptional regulator [Peptococcaceae bacterium]